MAEKEKNNLLEKELEVKEQELEFITDDDFEDEEESIVFKKKPKIIKEEDEEVVPQNNENYVVQSQIIEESIDGLQPRELDTEIKTSFLEYAMSVIVSRALPDARDGLKPVHRRILYDMSELGITHNTQHRKSARIVGDVLGKYHPHGDTSVYEAMVRLAQDFSMRYPLVDGHGNFGSIDGDGAAAMRYTEARLSKVASLMLEGIKKDTVDFMDNYDATEKEPTVLPSKFPNLLVSGVSGIAVGLATEIPPHNLSETIDATIALAKNPELNTLELMQYIKGPDFPTGATILDIDAIYSAYDTGRGSIPMRSNCEIEEFTSGKSRIIVTEIPYGIRKTTIIEKIAKLHKENVIQGISEIRDESNREGIRLIIEIKKGFNPNIVLNMLYTKSVLQSNFNVNMVALVEGEPRTITLKEALEIYLKHQKDVTTRGLKFDLNKAEDKLHILLGLKIAIQFIDEVIEIIKKSKTDSEAQEKLSTKFDLSERQTKAILDMSLRKLTGLNVEKNDEEISELQSEVARIKEILSDETKLIDLIISELEEVKRLFGDTRRTKVDPTSSRKISNESLIPESDIVITLSVKGYVKRLNLEEYREQKRGGKGSYSAKTYDDDDISLILQTKTHTDLLLFSNFGKVYKKRGHEIQEGNKQSKGIPFINLIPTLRVNEGEKIISILPVDSYEENKFLTTITKNGIIKKTDLTLFSNINRSGLNAFKLKDENDELLTAFIVDEESTILVANNTNNAIRFKSSDVRAMGRNAVGVKAMNLDDNTIVSASSEKDGDYILSIGSEGYGKLTHKDDFRIIKRGGKGVTAINGEKAGNLIFAKFVSKEDQALIITKLGLTIRLNLENVSVTSRNTKGVKIIDIKNNDEIVSVEIIKSDEISENEMN